MSATETAASDAAKIDSRLLDMFVTNETGVINSYANRDFISGWLNRVIPPNERGRYITNEGALSQEGLLRLKNAIFYKAYENPAIMAKFSESLDSNVKNITNAMLSLAPKFVSVKEQIQKGSLHNLDYSKDLADAAELYVRIRDRGQSVDEYLAQGNLFGDEVPAIVKDILYILENNKRSAKAINRFFAYVLDHVVKLGDPNQISIYGTVPTYNKVDVLEAIIRRFEDEGREQISLFPEAEVEVFQAGREVGTRDIADIRTERQGEVDVQRDAREKPRDDTGTESQAAQETALRNAMRNLAGDGAESLNATVTTTNTLEQRQLKNLLNELGINVVFYEADTPIPVNGFHDPLLSDTIFIRASETRNMAWATGHEFFHSLKANHADIHRAILSIYKDTITTEQEGKILKNLR